MSSLPWSTGPCEVWPHLPHCLHLAPGFLSFTSRLVSLFCFLNVPGPSPNPGSPLGVSAARDARPTNATSSEGIQGSSWATASLTALPSKAHTAMLLFIDLLPRLFPYHPPAALESACTKSSPQCLQSPAQCGAHGRSSIHTRWTGNP